MAPFPRSRSLELEAKGFRGCRQLDLVSGWNLSFIAQPKGYSWFCNLRMIARTERFVGLEASTGSRRFGAPRGVSSFTPSWFTPLTDPHQCLGTYQGTSRRCAPGMTIVWRFRALSAQSDGLVALLDDSASSDRIAGQVGLGVILISSVSLFSWDTSNRRCLLGDCWGQVPRDSSFNLHGEEDDEKHLFIHERLQVFVEAFWSVYLGADSNRNSTLLISIIAIVFFQLAASDAAISGAEVQSARPFGGRRLCIFLFCHTRSVSTTQWPMALTTF
jgi:hypothetical protein